MLTKKQRLLLAAEKLPASFTAEALTVQVWQTDPDLFCLRGFPEYPNHHKVYFFLCGDRGLCGTGHLVYDPTGRTYSLSVLGRQLVALLRGEVSNSLPVSEEVFVHSLNNSQAVLKFGAGHRNEVTFTEACLFWGLGAGVLGPEVDRRLDAFLRRLRALEALESDGGRLGEFRNLNNVHQHLLDRYERHLALLRGKAGRR